MCHYGDNTIFWYLPTEYSFDLAPTYAVTGKKIKFWFRVYLYEWLWDSGTFISMVVGVETTVNVTASPVLRLSNLKLVSSCVQFDFTNI